MFFVYSGVQLKFDCKLSEEHTTQTSSVNKRLYVRKQLVWLEFPSWRALKILFRPLVFKENKIPHFFLIQTNCLSF